MTKTPKGEDERVRDLRTLDAHDFLCLQYCLKLSTWSYEEADAILNAIDEHQKIIPLENIPRKYKTRFELHELLKTVVDAPEDKLIEDNFRVEIFHALTTMFEELDGANDADADMINKLKKSEMTFVRYQNLRQFEYESQINLLQNQSGILTLDNDEFEEYLKILCLFVSSCETIPQRYPSLISSEMTREELLFLYEKIPNFRIDLFKDFMRNFCFGLLFFHAKCGKGYYYEKDEDLRADLESLTSDESVNESLVIQGSPLRKRAVMKKLGMLEVIRSRSPVKAEERIEPGSGPLWDNSDTVSMENSSLTGVRRIKWSTQVSVQIICQIGFVSRL